MTLKGYDEMTPDQQVAYKMGRRVGYDDGRAAAWRDFPTDEMVRNIAVAWLDPPDEKVARAMLDDVRQVMLGEET